MNAKQTPNNLPTVDLVDLEISAADASMIFGGVRHQVTREEWERIVAQMIRDANKR